MTNYINDSSIKQTASIRAPTKGNTNIDGIHKLYYQRDYNHINNNIKKDIFMKYIDNIIIIIMILIIIIIEKFKS